MGQTIVISLFIISFSFSPASLQVFNNGNGYLILFLNIDDFLVFAFIGVNNNMNRAGAGDDAFLMKTLCDSMEKSGVSSNFDERVRWRGGRLTQSSIPKLKHGDGSAARIDTLFRMNWVKVRLMLNGFGIEAR